MSYTFVRERLIQKISVHFQKFPLKNGKKQLKNALSQMVSTNILQ